MHNKQETMENNQNGEHLDTRIARYRLWHNNTIFSTKTT